MQWWIQGYRKPSWAMFCFSQFNAHSNWCELFGKGNVTGRFHQRQWQLPVLSVTSLRFINRCDPLPESQRPATRCWRATRLECVSVLVHHDKSCSSKKVVPLSGPPDPLSACSALWETQRWAFHYSLPLLWRNAQASAHVGLLQSWPRQKLWDGFNHRLKGHSPLFLSVSAHGSCAVPAVSRHIDKNEREKWCNSSFQLGKQLFLSQSNKNV